MGTEKCTQFMLTRCQEMNTQKAQPFRMEINVDLRISRVNNEIPVQPVYCLVALFSNFKIIPSLRPVCAVDGRKAERCVVVMAGFLLVTMLVPSPPCEKWYSIFDFVK